MAEISNRNSSHPLIVGREREQAMLRQALDEMLAGHGSLVLVSGEAGIGKTTLVEWFEREAERDGCLILEGGCYDLSVTPPYGPWAEALASFTPHDSLPLVPPFVNDFAAFTALGSQERLFATTRDFLYEVAAGQPLLICLEDLHWADQASLDFLRVIGRGIANQRILIIATYRSDELHRHHPLYIALPVLVRESRAERLELRPLDDDATGEIIRHRYVLSESDGQRLERYLRERAEGNAFYALELLRSLEDAGALARKSGVWVLHDLTNVRLPALLRQVIESRLTRLGEETRSLLQVAAMIGQDVPLDLWQRVSDADDTALAATIEQGEAAQLLTEAGTGGRYRFRHALIREALYHEVILMRRRVWHRRIAEVLLEAANPDPDLVAYHFHQAGELRATQWLIHAGERAQWTYALLSAADRFEEAARQMEAHDSDVGERGWLLLRVGWLRRMSQPRLAITSIEKSLRLSYLAGDLTLSAYATFSLGLFRRVGGEPRKGLATLEEGVAAVDRLSSSERERLRERLAGWGLDETDPRGTLAVNLCSAGRYTEARHLADTVVSGILPPLRSPKVGGSGYADAFSALAIVHAALGQPDDASKAFSRADQIFRAIGDDFQSGLNAASMLFTVVLPYHADQIAERRRLASLADEALRRTNGVRDEDPRIAYLPLLELEGKWRELRQLIAAYDAGWDNVGWIVAPMAREQGDTDLAWKLVRQLMPEGPSTEPGSIGFVAALSYQRLATALSLDVGDLQSAQTWLDAHDRWLDWSGTVLGRAEGQLSWASYYQAAGDRSRALQCSNGALAHASNPRQPLALIAVHRFLGQLDTSDKRIDNAEQHLTASLHLADACAAPFERALTLLELAELRLAERRPDAATVLLDEVQAICEPLEAKPTLERVGDMRQQIRQTPKKTPTYPAGLSQREVEVLRLVAEGLTDAEIAERLFISRRTVTSHMTSIFNKLGVNARAAAAVWAKQHDLI